MNQRQFAAVLFAVLGIYLAASRLPEIITLVALLFQPTSVVPEESSDRRFILALIGLLIGVGLGIALVVDRVRLSNRLFPEGPQVAGPRELQAVALSVLGCYFAIEGLARMSWPASLARVDWTYAVEFVLGTALFVGARGLSRLWWSLRSVRMESREKATPTSEPKADPSRLRRSG